MRTLMIMTVWAFSLALVGCGGSGGGDSRSSAPSSPIGVAIVAIGKSDYSSFRLERWQLGAQSAHGRLSGPSSDAIPTRVGGALFVNRGARSYLLSVRSGSFRPLRLPRGVRAGDAVLAPRGDKVATTTGECVSPSAAALKIVSLGQTDAVQKIVPKLSGRARTVTAYPEAWSPDGTRLAYTVWRFGQECPRGPGIIGSDLYVLDTQRGVTSHIGASDYSISDVVIDPTGRWLAYRSEDNDIWSVIRVVSLQSGAKHVVARGNDVQSGPLMWSPKGETLVYVFDNAIHAYRPTAKSNVRLDGGGIAYGEAQIAGFSRDGRRVAYVASLPARELHVVTIDGRRNRIVALRQQPPVQFIQRVWADLD